MARASTHATRTVGVFGPYLTTALDEVGCDLSLSWVGLGWVGYCCGWVGFVRLVGVGVGEWWVLCGWWWVVVVVVRGRSQGWVGVRLVLGGVCFEAIAKILQRRHIPGHLKNLIIISGNIVPTYQVLFTL